jgi:hypothetical protein
MPKGIVGIYGRNGHVCSIRHRPHRIVAAMGGQATGAAEVLHKAPKPRASRRYRRLMFSTWRVSLAFLIFQSNLRVRATAGLGR